MANGAGVKVYRTKMGSALEASGVSFDPMVIITALIALFSSCVKPPPALVRLQSRRTGLVAVRLLNEVPTLDEETAFTIAEINRDVINSMSRTELQSVIDDATAGNEHRFAVEPDLND